MVSVLLGGTTSTPMENIQSALSTAFSEISTNLSTTVTSILPIALGIVGMGIVIVFGVKWFKRLTNKA